MPESLYWADGYIEKQLDAESAIRKIKPGQRVYIGSACGEPQDLVRALAKNAGIFTGLEVVRMMSEETIPLTAIATQNQEANFSLRQLYLGSTGSEHFESNQRFVLVQTHFTSPDVNVSVRSSTLCCSALWTVESSTLNSLKMSISGLSAVLTII